MDLLPAFPNDVCNPFGKKRIEEPQGEFGALERPVVERLLRKLTGVSSAMDEIDEWLEEGAGTRTAALCASGSAGSCALTLEHIDLLFAVECAEKRRSDSE